MHEILQVPVSIRNVPISCPAAPPSAGAAGRDLLLMQMTHWWEFSKPSENVWAIPSYFVSVASISGYVLESQKKSSLFCCKFRFESALGGFRGWDRGWWLESHLLEHSSASSCGLSNAFSLVKTQRSSSGTWGGLCRAGCVWRAGIAGYSCGNPVFSVEFHWFPLMPFSGHKPWYQSPQTEEAFPKSQRKQCLKNHHNTIAQTKLSTFNQWILELLCKKSLFPVFFLSHPPLLPLFEDYIQDTLVQAVLIVLAVSRSWKTKKSLLTRKMK